MTEPLALVSYERLLPGSQLVNRLQDLNYRVQAVADASALPACARQEKPLIIFLDLVSSRHNTSEVVANLKKHPETRHIPVIAFCPDDALDAQEAAQSAGATLVVSDAAVLNYLVQFLEQALRVE